MAGITSWRRRAAIVAAMALAAVPLTACAKKTDGGGGIVAAPTTNSGDSSLGTVPPTSAGSGGGSGSTGGGSGASQAPTYPSDAKSYGLEILKAWGSKNSTRLASLVDANSVTTIASYGFPNTQWINYICVPDPTNTNCTYTNGTGDIAKIMMANASLGKQHAGFTVTYDRTNIPGDGAGYVSAFVFAWTNDNYAAMSVYSNSSIVSHFQNLAKFPVGTMVQNAAPCTSNKAKTCVELDAVPPGSADTIYFVIDPAKVSAKKLNAILSYQSNP